MLQAWLPNTLPLPYPMAAVSAVEEAIPAASSVIVPLPLPLPLPQVIIDIADNFSKGRVVKFFPYQGYGFITDRNGREVYFNLLEMDFAGAKGKEAIVVGAPVGYDVAWTSRGLHVKKMKVY